VLLQVVMSSARTLADLTDEKQLPWDYLSAMLLLFVITVIDRLVYSLGSHLGKALLLLAQLLLFIPACMSLFWSPIASSSSSGSARMHLRVFIVLKACSWVTTALQLRSGFPPRASFDGGGRQRFVFYSKADVWHMMGFYTFQVRCQCYGWAGDVAAFAPCRNGGGVGVAKEGCMQEGEMLQQHAATDAVLYTVLVRWVIA
jgi:Zn-dependent protease with chaperone function